MKPSEVLRKAAEKIANPVHWTKEALARNAARYVVGPNDPAAVCWCALGAIGAVLPPGDLPGDVRRYLHRGIGYRPGAGGQTDDDIAFWNDEESDHDGVLAAFARAAELAESEGQ